MFLSMQKPFLDSQAENNRLVSLRTWKKALCGIDCRSACYYLMGVILVLWQSSTRSVLWILASMSLDQNLPPPPRVALSDDAEGESTESAHLQAQITALVNTGDFPITDNHLAAFADQLEIETDAGPPFSTQVTDILQSITTKR